MRRVMSGGVTWHVGAVLDEPAGSQPPRSCALISDIGQDLAHRHSGAAGFEAASPAAAAGTAAAPPASAAASAASILLIFVANVFRVDWTFSTSSVNSPTAAYVLRWRYSGRYWAWSAWFFVILVCSLRAATTLPITPREAVTAPTTMATVPVEPETRVVPATAEAAAVAAEPIRTVHLDRLPLSSLRLTVLSRSVYMRSRTAARLRRSSSYWLVDVPGASADVADVSL